MNKTKHKQPDTPITTRIPVGGRRYVVRGSARIVKCTSPHDLAEGYAFQVVGDLGNGKDNEPFMVFASEKEAQQEADYINNG